MFWWGYYSPICTTHKIYQTYSNKNEEIYENDYIEYENTLVLCFQYELEIHKVDFDLLKWNKINHNKDLKIVFNVFHLKSLHGLTY